MENAVHNKRLDELFEQIDAILPFCNPEHVRIHAFQLMREADRIERSREPETWVDPQLQLAEQAREFMESRMQERVTTEQVAAACHVSPTTLKQAFRTTYGMPIGQWNRARRVDQARELLLETDLSITEVAAAVGYANPSKFAKVFRDQVGTAPQEWREQHGGR